MESFVSEINSLVIEMKWQQKLGQTSIWLKIFANHWNDLSWINFLFINIVNLMFIIFLTIDPYTGTIGFA